MKKWMDRVCSTQQNKMDSMAPMTSMNTGAAEATSGVAVLDRAFALLGAFGPEEERLTLTELSKRTDMYKSTALRLLIALEHGGFIRKLEDGAYAVGPEPMRLAAIYQRSFRMETVVQPLLEELSNRLGETASFYIRVGSKRLVLSRVEPARTVRVSIRIGEEFDVHRGASGKVLLAFGGDGEGSEEVRSQLWATSYGERDPETASASVPVFGALGELKGALTISGPISRLGKPDAMHAAVDALRDAARRATVEFGGNPARYPAGYPAGRPASIAT